MPIYDYPTDHGDLFVTYQVELPKALTEEQKKSKLMKQLMWYRIQRGVFNVTKFNFIKIVAVTIYNY